MRFSAENKTWEIVDMSNITLAFYNETSDFPMGTRHWYFLDQNCTDPGKPWRSLNLQEITEQPGIMKLKYLENQLSYNCDKVEKELGGVGGREGSKVKLRWVVGSCVR